MIKGFIFDMDGVLTDTAKVSVALVTSYFKSLGTTIPDDIAIRNLGKGMRKSSLG